MDRQNIIEQFIVKEILMEGGERKIGADESLLSSGILDSLTLLRLIHFIEEQFQIEVADGEVVPDNFESLGAISAYVTAKVEKK